jgi:DNA-directed RNA polymerase II subunit RPB2
MLNRGDDYYIAICNNSGTIAIYNESKNVFISPFADGPLKFSDTMENSLNLQVISKYGKSFSIVRVPYSFKLLMQELQVMNIQMRIITEDNIDQLTSMNYSKTIENIKLTQLTAKETSEFVKRYEKPLLTPETQSTESIAQEPLKLKEPESQEEKGDYKDEDKDEDEDEDDESSIDPESIKAVRAAEESYKKYLAAEALEDEDYEDEETMKPAINIDTQDTSPLELDDVISIPTDTSQPENIPIKEPELQEVTDTLLQPNLELENPNTSDVENSKVRKTVKFEGQ